MMPSSSNHEKDYSEVVKTLRHEASELKECFNRQCFQVIAIVSTFYIYLFHFMISTNETTGVTSINFSLGIVAYLAVIIIVTVINVGIYKFEAANRLIGYILHLERTGVTSNLANPSYTSLLNWETSIKAWRVVHSPIENHLYYSWTKRDRKVTWDSIRLDNPLLLLRCILKWLSVQLLKGVLKYEHKKRDRYRWYLPDKLVHSDSDYSSGNYLRRMMFMLHLLGVVALVLIWLATFRGTLPAPYDEYVKTIYVPTMILIGIYMWWRPMILVKRIESQLFSIHSCSIFWQVVTTAHRRTIRIIRQNYSLKHYSFILSCLALHFIDFGVHRAHEWCDNKTFKEATTWIINNKIEDYEFKIKEEKVEVIKDNLKKLLSNAEI